MLLDHGLYRRLDDQFRLEYAGLWRSLIFGGGGRDLLGAARWQWSLFFRVWGEFGGGRVLGRCTSKARQCGWVNEFVGLASQRQCREHVVGAVVERTAWVWAGRVSLAGTIACQGTPLPALLLRTLPPAALPVSGAPAPAEPAALSPLLRALLADEEGIRRHAGAMNAGHSVPLFAGMLTNRPWEEVARKGAPPARLQLQYTQEEASMIQVGGVEAVLFWEGWRWWDKGGTRALTAAVMQHGPEVFLVAGAFLQVVSPVQFAHSEAFQAGVQPRMTVCKPPPPEPADIALQ